LSHGDGGLTIWNGRVRLGANHSCGASPSPWPGRLIPTAASWPQGGEEAREALGHATHREIVRLKPSQVGAWRCHFSGRGRLATGGGGAEAVKLWTFKTHQELITLAGEGSLTTFLRFSPDGNKLSP